MSAKNFSFSESLSLPISNAFEMVQVPLKKESWGREDFDVGGNLELVITLFKSVDSQVHRRNFAKSL